MSRSKMPQGFWCPQEGARQANKNDAILHHNCITDFTPVALLELDYGRVASLFSGADLALDDSAELVHESLDALHKLDYDRAGRAYGRVAERWAKAQALTYVN